MIYPRCSTIHPREFPATATLYITLSLCRGPVSQGSGQTAVFQHILYREERTPWRAGERTSSSTLSSAPNWSQRFRRPSRPLPPPPPAWGVSNGRHGHTTPYGTERNRVEIGGVLTEVFCWGALGASCWRRSVGGDMVETLGWQP